MIGDKKTSTKLDLDQSLLSKTEDKELSTPVTLQQKGHQGCKLETRYLGTTTIRCLNNATSNIYVTVYKQVAIIATSNTPLNIIIQYI